MSAVSSSTKRGHFCCRVFEKPAHSDLAVPERVDVDPLLLKGAARCFGETPLVAQDDDGVALCDDLARLKVLKFEGLLDQGEELRDPLVPTVNAGKRDRCGAL